MRVIAYTIVHYGIEYLDYAVRSVSPLVNKHNIFYTPHPSHGKLADIPPVERQSKVIESVTPSPKVQWYLMSGIYHEGLQRDECVRHCAEEDKADLILVVDYDEIWHTEVLAKALEQAATSGARNNILNFTHFWRSFNWVCRDQGWPVRIINPHITNGPEVYYLSDIGEVYHFGYAISDRVMRYKMRIHGHRSEFREGWLDTHWGKWPPPPDCHPTNDQNFWMPEPFDKAKLPPLMREHPFYNLERID